MKQAEMKEKAFSLIAEIRHLLLTHPQEKEKDQSILSQLEEGKRQITGGHPVTQGTLGNLALILGAQRAIRESLPEKQAQECEYCHHEPATMQRRVLLAQDEAHPDMEARTPRLWLCHHCISLLIGGYPCECAACSAARPTVTLANYWELTINQKETIKRSK